MSRDKFGERMPRITLGPMTLQETVTNTAVQRLRMVSVLETLSFVVLLAMMISHSDLGVSIAGATHGFLFLAYAYLVLRYRDELGWSGGYVALVILTGPIGPIIVLEHLRRR